MIPVTRFLCGSGTVSTSLRRAAHGGRADPAGLRFSSAGRPVVVWNATRRCNLACEHCYISAGEAGPEELSTSEARGFIEDLAAMGVPVLIFSGGEPTLREDLLALGAHAVKSGLRAVISSNGTTIDEATAAGIAAAGFSYVGVSIDGAPATHDRFRGKSGAFDAALRGLRSCAAAGIRSGVRFTVNAENLDELPWVLDLAEREGAARFCMYHLVYSGRAREIASKRLSHEQTRAAVEVLVEKALEWDRRGVAVEILTADNAADGALVERIVSERLPERAEELRRLQSLHGGCSAGRKIAAVDASGEVRPCQFWTADSLGNVRERAFSEIWNDESNELLAKLRSMPGPLTGPRCSRCVHRSMCGGCRVRAEFESGDTWGDDPDCYLTLEEIGCA